jgi:hypothetical protein
MSRLCMRRDGADKESSRQAALQKALSTALLNHQISELESKVQSIQIAKGGAKPAAIGGQAKSFQMPAAADQAGHGESGKGKFAGFGRIDMDAGDRADALTHDEDIEVEGMSQDDEDDKWRVAVLDASVLIWAPRSVRRLAAKGWEMVLPIDGRSAPLLCDC